MNLETHRAAQIPRRRVTPDLFQSATRPRWHLLERVRLFSATSRLQKASPPLCQVCQAARTRKKIPGTLDLFITCTDKRNARGSHFLVLIALIKSQPAAEETGVKPKQWSWRRIFSAQRWLIVGSGDTVGNVLSGKGNLLSLFFFPPKIWVVVWLSALTMCLCGFGRTYKGTMQLISIPVSVRFGPSWAPKLFFSNYVIC